MKHFAFIFGGLIFGAFSNEGWGVWVGGVLGLLLSWIGSLSQKVNQLESKLLDFESRRNMLSPIPLQTDSDETATAESPDKQSNNDSDISKPVVDGIDSIPVVALAVDESTEIQLEQRSSSLEDEISSGLMTESVVDQMPVMTPSDSGELKVETSPNIISDTSKNDTHDPVTTREKMVEAEPSAIELAVINGMQKLKGLIVGYFTGGNSLVRTGMLVLFVGVAFLLKYVAERTVVPVEVRYIGIVLGSMVLLGLGWRLRKKRPGFALSLQGGGIGVLYLTLFAAMRLHQLIPPSMVLLCLVGVVILSATLAILQNSMALAVIGVLGGFAAPILSSTGSGSHVQLFAYYLLLNLSVFGIAWFKSWRLLNLLGFFATFAVGSVWGFKYYQPEYFASVEPFLIAHFLLYVLIAVLFAFKQPPKLKGINDGTLVFGTPIVVFSLQAGLVKDMTYGLAYSALILGVFYVTLAYVVKRLHRPFFKNLIESFIALGVGFATLAIPLGFDGRVTSAMWVAEASALVWVGLRQQRMLPRFSGYALAALGSLAFFVEPAGSLEVIPFLNADFVGVLIVVTATAFMGLYARKYTQFLLPIETPWIPRLMMVSAMAWWTMGGFVELAKHFPNQQYLLIQVWLLAAVGLLIYWGQRLSYGLLLGGALVLNGLMLPLLFDIPIYSADSLMFGNIRFLAMFLVAAFYLVMTAYWKNSDWFETDQKRRWVARFFLVSGVSVWLVAMALEIHKFMPLKQLLWNEVMMAVSAGMLLWHGHRKQDSDFKWISVFVTLLMFMPLYLTMGTHVWLMPTLAQDPLPILNVSFMALMVYFVTHFLVGNYWQKHMCDTSQYGVLAARVLLILSLLAWVVNGAIESDALFNLPAWISVFLSFISASFILFVWAAHRLHWQDLHQIKYGMTPFLLLLVIVVPVFQDFHQAYGLYAWLFAFMVNYWLLKIYDDKNMKMVIQFHVLSLWLLSFVIVFEFVTVIDLWIGSNNIWYVASYAGMLWFISTLVYAFRKRLKWPLVAHAAAYFKCAIPVMFWLQWLMLLVMNFNDPGQLLAVPYLPVLNVIDVLGLCIIWLGIKINQMDQSSLFIKDVRIKYSMLAGTVFLMLNASMLRCFHYWYGIDYQFSDLMSSFMVQTGFSILWAATAVTLMVVAARKHWRAVWLLGLGLMIAVVAKLFLIDMSASGSIERIVAFLSVGFLLSLVGYFSPLPPEIKQNDVNRSTEATDAG